MKTPGARPGGCAIDGVAATLLAHVTVNRSAVGNSARDDVRGSSFPAPERSQGTRNP
jgi:hypothetical protein